MTVLCGGNLHVYLSGTSSISMDKEVTHEKDDIDNSYYDIDYSYRFPETCC